MDMTCNGPKSPARDEMDITASFSNVTHQELYKKMKNGEDFVLIDTLTHDHFEKVHIPGAKNACVFEVVFLSNVEGIISDRKREVVVYGSSTKSKDAVTAAEKLVSAGYSNVIALDGGLELWRKADYPLEGSHAASTDSPETELSVEKGIYRVKADESLIEWTGRNVNKKHYGALKVSRGELTVKDESIKGSFEIDMTSIKDFDLDGDELQPVLLSHLKSEDFFLVKMFPRAFFILNSATLLEKSSLSSPNFEVKGSLDLRGIKKGITFPATVNPLPEGGAMVEAHFDIDRTRWGVIYGSSRFFEHLGMHLVFDLISIQLRIVVERREYRPNSIHRLI
jgi:rhodanese-related sulfurtransferase/polyisoprenoid-binding protein YceI